MNQQERRAHPDSKVRDRRYVSRLAHPTIRDSVEQIHLFINVVSVLSIVVTLALIIQGVTSSSETLVRNVALAIISGLFSALLILYSKSLKTYLKLETPTSLGLCFERQRNVWMFTSFIFVVALLGFAVFNL